MAPFKNILLIGAGGTLGMPILQAFLNSSSYKVSILARKESTSIFPEGIPVFKADYTNQSEIQLAMEGQDVVICTIGANAAGDQNIFIDAAIAAGVQRFFPSEFGPYPRDANVITGIFFDWTLKIRFFGFNFTNKTASLINNSTAVITACTLLYITKAKDILGILEEVQGQKWTVKHLKSESVITNSQKMLAEGDFRGVLDLTRGGIFSKQELGDNRRWGLWDDNLELEKQGIEQAVRDIL
ncbi:isoflavone reductase [Ilyonectria robusta]|uniref:isoflavone reductase n=1 Tax=Ilyonectria robusta TaxID=1079257 RepID=UPI001E8D93BA|nr:isoflavone reductase [Ilyonectria robusta]KAH8688550.1 isoflavone reductase [Ilyonectria robusta]